MIAIVVIAFGATVVGTWLVREYARRHALLDVPNDRSSHAEPTPRGGGLSFVVASAVLAGYLAARGTLSVNVSAALAIGALLLGTVGWLDDRRGVAASSRIVVQLVAACAAVALLGGLGTVHAFGSAHQLGAWGSIAAIVLLVWLTNLFNFMDGVDGIAALVAIIAMTCAALTVRTPAPGLSGMAAGIAAAVAGFLVWNWPRASIFMGDVGSGYLGFSLGVVAIAGEHAGTMGIAGLLAPAAPFVVDATLTLVVRLARGKVLWEAHRDHVYQRLARRTRSHGFVTVAYGAVAVACGVAVNVSARSGDDPARPVVAIVIVLSLAYGVLRRLTPDP